MTNNLLNKNLMYFIICIIVNYIYGRKAGERSLSTPTKATPPGIFFAIWGLIYLSLASLYAYALYNSIFFDHNIISQEVLFNMKYVHLFNILWVLSNNISNLNYRLLLQTPFIYALGYYLFESIGGSLNSSLVSNIISFYFGWVLSATFLTTLITSIYVFKLNFLNSLSKGLGIIWGVIGLILWSNTYTNIMGFYFSLAWGMIGIMLNKNK